MAIAPATLKALQDLQTALEAVISSESVGAVEAEVNSLLPASVQPWVASLEAATLSSAQAAVASLLAKIPTI